MSQYYEAVLQLRNFEKKVFDYVMSEIRARGVEIARTERQKNGIDLQLSSKSFALAIGKKLASKFGGRLKTSAKLVTAKKGKDIYRVSVMYEPSQFQEGDVVEVEGRLIKIRNVGKLISGTDLISRKHVKIERKGKQVARLEKFKAAVSQKYPSLEVIHPETYQSARVENPKETRKPSVAVVISKSKIFLAD
mgnify:CR=1 FL=1